MTAITVRTKLDARSTEKTETAVTIDWSTISQEDLQKLAQKTIIIAAQSQWRAASEIPTEATLNAADFANPARKPRGPMDVKALLAKMDPAERRAFIEAELAKLEQLA